VPSLKGGDDLNKSRKVTYRLTEKDFKRVEKNAKKANLNLSQYLEKLSQEAQVLDFKELEEINYKLSKIGNNINQLTMLAHQGRIKTIDFTDFEKAFSGMWDELIKLTEGR
jgi:hypothetical protein